MESGCGYQWQRLEMNPCICGVGLPHCGKRHDKSVYTVSKQAHTTTNRTSHLLNHSSISMSDEYQIRRLGSEGHVKVMWRSWDDLASCRHLTTVDDLVAAKYTSIFHLLIWTVWSSYSGPISVGAVRCRSTLGPGLMSRMTLQFILCCSTSVMQERSLWDQMLQESTSGMILQTGGCPDDTRHPCFQCCTHGHQIYIKCQCQRRNSLHYLPKQIDLSKSQNGDENFKNGSMKFSADSRCLLKGKLVLPFQKHCPSQFLPNKKYTCF